MLIPNFLCGSDTQRSTNLADNRCINLYPTLNDDGTVGALVRTPGLTLEATISGSAIGSGIYTASNGRAFVVASTILYEVIKHFRDYLSNFTRNDYRCTSRMSDNGLELIIVNGTNGWILTFATNVLAQIKVVTKTFTVTLANPAVFTAATCAWLVLLGIGLLYPVLDHCQADL